MKSDIKSTATYALYGEVRGLVAESDDLDSIVDAMVADTEACTGQGGYSDVVIYESDDDGGWDVMDISCQQDGSVISIESGRRYR